MSLLAWAVSEAGLSETGAYFIAIPGLVAAAIALLPVSRDSRSRAIRMTLIVLLASALIIREGFICILMASPLILLVVVLATPPPNHYGSRSFALLAPLLLLGSIEGVAFDLPTEATVEERRVIVADIDLIEDALATADELPQIKPLLLRLPFPKPTEFATSGLDIGDQQLVSFDAAQMRSLVVERTVNSVQWQVIEDTTPIGEWYAIDSIEIAWQAVHDPDRPDVELVELSITIDYERQLSPGFYFDPLGRVGVGSLADVLADMVEVNLDAQHSVSASR